MPFSTIHSLTIVNIIDNESHPRHLAGHLLPPRFLARHQLGLDLFDWVPINSKEFPSSNSGDLPCFFFPSVPKT